MKLYLVDKGELKEINKPVFSTGDVYILDNNHTIYVWIGSKCSVDEKTSGAAQARTLDQERGGAAKIITIDQGQETADFLKLITDMGAMKIVNKNIAKTMLKDVFTGDYAGFTEHKNVLYRVSSEEFEDINTMKMVQVPYSEDSLDSEDCFVMDLGTKVYVWQGNACNVKEKVRAGQWARKIDVDRAGSQNEEIFEEGDDMRFIEALKKGTDYKESDAVQLEAESVMEEEPPEQKIEREHKSEIRDAEPEERVSIKPEAPKIKESAASKASPGIPGRRDDSILTIEKTEGRRVCPNCGEENPHMLHESIDKSNVIMDYPRVYGKKYKCGSCGTEWREK
ncbi:MAG: hypothetical protein EU518_01280 [Promethearchaeota archaeon]|nr:MAG: hypothetical protein EU518_01280 [Candidatus Lokiarchaeota archaeon]